MPSDLVQTSSLRPHSKIVFMMRSSIVSGNKHGMKIGIRSGVRRNKSIGCSKNIAYYLIWKLIILEGGMNFAEKICSTKISRNISEHSINRIISKNQISTIFYQLPFCFQASTSSSTRSLSELKMTANLCGSWNLYIFDKSDLEVPGERYLHLQQSWRSVKVEII